MSKITYLTVVFTLVTISNAALSGPYLFWGPQTIKNLEKPMFKSLDIGKFKDVVENVKLFVVFSSSKALKLDADSFPRLNEIVGDRKYFYFPNSKVDVDLYEARNRTKIIHIDANDSNIDNTISDEYLALEKKYGTENILALLSGPDLGGAIKKRNKREDNIEVEEEPEDNGPFIYNVPGKALFYTETAPVLRMISNDLEETEGKNGTKGPTEMVYEMKNHDLVTLDDRDQLSRLIVTFKLGDGYKVTLRFRFPLSLLYWSLTNVELEDSRGMNLILPVTSIVPTAPMGFSHKCTYPLVFKNGTTSLTMTNVQVQPALKGNERFGDAYDCVGFTTMPIWSGIFVTTFLLGILVFAILAIMDIRTPNKFENSKTKLTLTNCE